MSSPFASIMDPTGPAGQQNEASKQPSDGANNANVGAQSHKSDSETPRSAVILRHPAAGPSPEAQYLDPSIDLENLPIPFTRFPGIRRVLPDREGVSAGWSAFVEEVAPDPAPVIERKDRVSYYIAGTLKEAELINKKLREKRLSKGQSTIGKQRSSAHVETLGPALFLDDDGDVFAREGSLRALRAAAVVFSSHSFGFKKDNATQPSSGGHVVLVLNRTVTPDEYASLWDAVNHLLGGGFDEHGRSAYLCYGRHARRSNEAPFRRTIIDGAALDADALIELGRSLRPEHSRAIASPKTAGGRKRALIEEIERTKLMGTVRAPDEYGEWISGAAAFKRAFPSDNEAAFQCYDAWSACSSKYQDGETTRQKFDQVPTEYKGTAAPVALEMLHWRARRRAEKVIDTLYSPAKPNIPIKIPALF
jgi:Primase C terminal 2 (PriCT-2)